MPIRGLETHLRQSGLITQRPLGELRGRTVGIEVSSWVRTLNISEPLQSATGGPPVTLERAFESAVSHLVDELGVRPLFVFSGMQTLRNSRYFGPSGSKREAAWQSAQASPHDAPNAFRALSRGAPNAYPLVLQRVLERRGLSWLCAPYQAWAQLGHYSSQASIDAAFGGLENLLFGCPNIIVSVDPHAQTYEMVDAHQVLAALQLTLSGFLDVCILAGFELCHTFPPLASGGFRFPAAIQMIKQYGSGSDAIAAQGPRVADYMEVFSRTKAAVKHHLVLPSSAVAMPLNSQFAPADLHLILGPRLPNSVYYFVSMGAIRPNVLNALLSGCLLESTPLVDSGEYRRLLNELIPMRASVLSLLGTCLNPELLLREVTTVRWYDPNSQYAVPGSRVPELAPDLECVLTEKIISEHVKPGTLDIRELLLIVEELDAPAAKASRKPNVASQLEYHAKVLQEGLRQLGYIKSDSVSLSLFGEALVIGQRAPEFVQAHLCALHMLQLGFVTSGPLAMQREVAPTCSPHVTLISRLLVLVGLEQAPEGAWEGPVDHDLMGYASMCRALTFSLGNVFDVVAQVLFTNKRVATQVECVRRVALKAPFRHETGTHVALLVKAALSEPSTFTQEVARAAFPSVKDAPRELKRALRFWRQLREKIDYIIKNAPASHAALPACKAVMAADAHLKSLRLALLQ